MAGRIISDNIQQLSKCEIFVFGSNLAGQHHGGAARLAHRKFGAEWGVGAGRTGQCYAIPTMHGGVDDIKPYVDEFTEYAKAHPNNRFLVTRIGCGIAGFTDDEMAPLFKEAWKLPNVNVSIDWAVILDDFVDSYMFGIIPEEEIVPIPDAIDELDLIRLTEKYKYVIGARVKVPLPKINIRYVIDNNRFGYAHFGDFIMLSTNDLYVWTRNKEFAEDHNQDIVEGFFEDECKGRGYLHRVLFAGVKTPYKDSNGESIYTGDVIDVNDGEMILALGTLGENANPDLFPAKYAFKLDNHSLFPEDCKKMTRVGTVFFQLDWNDCSTIEERCLSFQGIYPGGIPREDKTVMAKYTPNFDREIWKYHALEIIGVEFHWRN